MQLLLIRHGQSRGNIDQIIQDDDDPLTDIGRLQADVLGRYLASTHTITTLYASPLERARETAQIVGRYINREPLFEPGLAEMCAGSAAGMTWDAWSESFPEQAARLRTRDRSLEDRWEGGESGHEFMSRVLGAYDRIVEQHRASDDTVAVVSHGGALAWIASRVFGDPDDVWPFDRAVFANCSISELTIDAKGAHTIGAWNQQDHLLQDR